MQRPIWRLGASLVIALGIIAACGGGKTPTDEPELGLTANPRQINDEGQASQITISATSADGTEGTGTVTLKATAGALGNSTAEETVTLAGGTATASFTCNKVADPKCAGSVRIDATWGTATASYTLTVGPVSTGGDGGTKPDGGTTTPDGGTTKPDGGTTLPDAGPVDAGIRVAVTTSKPTVVAEVSDFADITAILTILPNIPRPGELVTFDTSLGNLQVNNGTPAPSVEATTDSAGKAIVRFVETGTTGTATVRARHTASGAQSTVTVAVTAIQQITYQTTLCGGQACTIMGVRGSGFNEQAQLTFKVIDSTGQPAVGVPVTFSIPNAPSGTSVSPTGTTNALGIVTATVSAGPVIGSIVVKAVAIAGRVQVDGPNIGIRGAKVSNKGFSFSCTKVNLGVYIAAAPPYGLTVDCRVKVVDRFSNPVGTGTTVNFKVEAGNISNSVQTKAYSPSGQNTDEGTGTVPFNTAGGTFPPVDVDPLPADPAQFPQARVAETQGARGQLVANPRDNLVTLLAYTRGEEWFDDSNSNGTWDQGEQFIDQGEPFVDSNDNGIRDVGELYIDEAPADGQWNGPNGIWDNNTTIWTETRLLFTGPPAPTAEPAPFSRPCVQTTPPSTLPDPLLKTQAQNFVVHNWDGWFNLIQAGNMNFSSTHSATAKGTVTLTPASAVTVDGFGFVYNRELFSTSDGKLCTASSSICIWKVYFTQWYSGALAGKLTNTSAAASPCTDDTVTFSATIQSPNPANPFSTGTGTSTGALE